MSKQEANLVFVLCLGLMLLVWLIEFKGIFDFSVGGPQEAIGRIAGCGGIGKKTGWLKWKKERIVIRIDSFAGGIEFKRPVSVKEEIISLCERRGRVRAVYRTWKPPLRSDQQYWLLGITDLGTNRIIFTPSEFDAWKRGNRVWAHGIFGLAFLGLLYAVGARTGIVSRKGSGDFKHDQQHGYYRGQFRIQSRQRRAEAFVYLAVFGGLAATFGYYYLTRKIHSPWLLLPTAVFLAGAYAYLVEIINISELRFEAGVLIYRRKPLPWFSTRRRIPVDQIEGLVAEATRELSLHGPYTLYSVSVRHPEGDKTILFFTNGMEEAEAIAELTNRHLAAQYPRRRTAEARS